MNPNENRRVMDTCPPWLQNKLEVLEKLNSNLLVLEEKLNAMIAQGEKHEALTQVTITNSFSLKLIGIGLVVILPFIVSWNVYITNQLMVMQKQIATLEAKR